MSQLSENQMQRVATAAETISKAIRNKTVRDRGLEAGRILVDIAGRARQLLSERVRIKKTKLGKGVFARRVFRKNQVIGQMSGVLVREDFDPAYCVDMGRFGFLEPTAPFRFLNHSCEPNCALLEWEPKRRGEPPRVFVHALRSIREGEQLTIDYAWPAEAAIPCLCATAGCRGWIVDPKELPQVSRRRRSRRKRQSPRDSSPRATAA